MDNKKLEELKRKQKKALQDFNDLSTEIEKEQKKVISLNQPTELKRADGSARNLICENCSQSPVLWDKYQGQCGNCLHTHF